MSARLRSLRWESWSFPHRLSLLTITLLSVFFNFWTLGQNGFGNLYYAAAVKSMGSNWHAFFFTSLDPAGFVSIDKPPAGFWLQVVSTKIFGFTPFALFFPQALAGVLSVVVLYWLVRRHFGRVAGLIAALALAASPIIVVTNRNNTIDSTLMFVLLLAAWATFRAIETDTMVWLMGSALLVGIGFNVKMLEAYLVIPAFFLAYVMSSRKAWLQRAGQIVISGTALVAVSLLWVIGVDFFPPTLRPFVGSTLDNSELSLALGYNGLQRLTGRKSTSSSGGNNNRIKSIPDRVGAQHRLAANAHPASTRIVQSTSSVGGTGSAGVVRLFTNPLGGQIAWLLPIAIFGLVALAADRPIQPREDRQHQSLLLWGTWLVTTIVYFSVAGFVHPDYLSQMAPSVAALVGIGVVTMWKQSALPDWRGWLFPVALAVTALVQIALIISAPTWVHMVDPLHRYPLSCGCGRAHYHAAEAVPGAQPMASAGDRRAWHGRIVLDSHGMVGNPGADKSDADSTFRRSGRNRSSEHQYTGKPGAYHLSGCQRGIVDVSGCYDILDCLRPVDLSNR